MVATTKRPETEKPKPSNEPTQSIAEFQKGALIVKDASAMGVLSVVAGKHYKDTIHPASYQIYRDRLLKDSGGPSDPVEIMLLDQMMVANHQIGNLLVQASMATSPEAVAIYTTATTKLMAEYRRGALALKEYRSPTMPKQVTVVRQQNVAAGDQQVALIEQGVSKPPPEKDVARNELGSNQQYLTHEQTPTFKLTSDCREAEPVEIQRLDARGSSEAAADSDEESSLVTFYGSPNGRR